MVVKVYSGDGASLSAAGSKRSAVSASDAECFSLCLGAGPLWWSDVPASDSAPPGGVTGGAASPATPSTPTHDDNNRDLLSALLWGSASSLSSSAESLYSDPHPALQTQHQQAVVNKILERKDRQPVKIDFKIFLTENTMMRWEAVVQGNSMFLRLPGVLQAGSKESFMLLLDFAEERLHVANCIICVLKSRSDRATLLRTFMFMGFTLLPPAAPLLPPELTNPDYIFLHYNMQ
ncbi:LOW QUALITY PROTEIN: ornithine decarboxylase antizyme [Choristoneura fumiferana]|uniref:LOW QUALITY PROTEIN: ornithine decarboxylase antizyme n=1 Tax=Choristoneura fumiferana TaxID=7141 RepID=UPI003D155789